MNKVVKKNKIYKVLYFTLILLLVYNCSLIIQSIIFPNKIPSFFGIKTFVVSSGSMKPNLDIGDIVFIKSVDSSNLEVGDIISYREGKLVVTHRIYSIIHEENLVKYETKGDNNNVSDSALVNSYDIEGRLIGKIPYLGNFLLLMRNRFVIIFIILLYYFLILKRLKKES